MPGTSSTWIKYDPVLKDRASAYKIVLAAAREAMKGNAPVSIDVRNMEEGEREKFRLLMVSHGWQPLLFEKCLKEEGYDILRDNIEWQPAYESNKLGIDTTLSGESSLKGLFAAGMARVLGINPFTGWSIASCTWSGYVAGESAARYSKGTESKPPDSPICWRRREGFLNLSSGPRELIRTGSSASCRRSSSPRTF